MALRKSCLLLLLLLNTSQNKSHGVQCNLKKCSGARKDVLLKLITHPRASLNLRELDDVKTPFSLHRKCLV